MAEALPSKECPICFTTIRTKGMLECMHCFCVNCIVEWRGNKHTQKCPICKTPFQDILKIRPDGSSKVIEPKRCQTFPHSHHQHHLIRPPITPFRMGLFGDFESALTRENRGVPLCISPYEPLTSLPVPEPTPEPSFTPQPAIHIPDPEFLIPPPPPPPPQPELLLPRTIIPEIGTDEYCALFFCPCGNSWESRKSNFIVDPENCPNCKRDVLPEY